MTNHVLMLYIFLECEFVLSINQSYSNLNKVFYFWMHSETFNATAR